MFIKAKAAAKVEDGEVRMAKEKAAEGKAAAEVEPATRVKEEIRVAQQYLAENPAAAVANAVRMKGSCGPQRKNRPKSSIG